MTLIIHEMLRKKGNATQQKYKATQHNSPKEKAALGGTRTHDRPLSRCRSYPLATEAAQLAGLESHIQVQYKATKAPQPMCMFK